MAKSNTSSMDDPINVRQSYQQKGTFKMAKSIVEHRGFLGLYSGFSLHLRKLSAIVKYLDASSRTSFSERYDWYGYLFHDLRKHETIARQISRQ